MEPDYFFIGGSKHGKRLPSYGMHVVQFPHYVKPSFETVYDPKSVTTILSKGHVETYHRIQFGFGPGPGIPVFVLEDLMQGPEAQEYFMDVARAILGPREPNAYPAFKLGPKTEPQDFPYIKQGEAWPPEDWHYEYENQFKEPTKPSYAWEGKAAKPAPPPEPKKDQITIRVGEREVSWDLDDTNGAVMLQWLVQTRGPGKES